MSTENKNDKIAPTTKLKHTGLYYIAAIVCACILTTAILLVVFLPGRQNTLNNKPGIDTPVDVPTASQEVPYILPVANAEMGQGFAFWHNQTLDKYELHKGLDFKAAAGTEVKAVAAGTVVEAKTEITTGGRVIIDHGNGVKSVYKSIDVAENIKEGSKVTQGSVIGKVSSDVDCMGDEKNLGSHLHFEMLKDNQLVDPKLYLVLDEK